MPVPELPRTALFQVNGVEHVGIEVAAGKASKSG